MPAMKMSFPHQLGQEQAAERLKGFLEKLRHRHADKLTIQEDNWVGNVLNFAFSTFGFKISGAMTVGDDDIKLDGQLPIAAMMFKGKIESEIKAQMQRLLA